MRTMSFRTVLEDVLGMAGYPYDTASQSQLDQAARFINRHVQYFHEWGPWPDWTRAEFRPFADQYYSTVTYGIGDVVYYNGEYYSATAITIGNLPTDTNYWEETTTPDPAAIAYEQAYQNKIGRPWKVTKHNPYTTERASQYSYPYNLSATGLIVMGANLDRVWVLFSDPAPVFSAKVHNVSQAYSQYDVVYYPGTEDSDIFPNRGWCYYADIDSSGAQVWIPVGFPKIAHNYVVNKAAADMLRHYGNKELAVTYDQMASGLLLDEWDKINTVAYQNIIGVQ